MKKYYSLLIAIMATAISIAQPTITSFSPVSGPVGTTVVINGSNFNIIPGNNIVYFGSVKATVTASASSSITVSVPVAASFKYISVTNLATNLTAYSTKPFHVTFGCNTTVSGGSFSPKMDISTGNHPVSTVTGDLDGDGKLELVTANRYGNSISVLMNTSTSGSIAYGSPVDMQVGTNPWSVSLGDLDGDGRLDIAVAVGPLNKVSVFRNTSTVGAISFASQVDFITSNEPYSVAIGDIDADGKPDLVTANSISPGVVSVLKNVSTIGSIAFMAKMNFSTGGHPKSVAICDLDGDGKPDLTTANYNTSSNSISILRNTTTGAISFATKVDYPTGSNPYYVAIGDIDGNGQPDIAVPNNSSATVSIFRNSSTVGVISFASKVDFVTGNSPVSAAIEDLDGNGKLDLVVTNQYSNTVSCYKNTSTTGLISFAAKVDLSTGTIPYSLAIADLDNDQRPDIATGNATASSISIFRGLMCPVGIFENEESIIYVNVYPNPFSSFATIEIEDFLGEELELRMYDILGKEVLNQKITNSITRISRESLRSGVYFIQIVSENTVILNTKAVIKD